MSTAMAALAIVIAIAALAVNFVIPGPTGPAGAAGAAGQQGIQGIQGVQGNPGTNGINGTNGTNGINGTNGLNGVNATALWAVVNADGSLANGSSHVVSTAQVGGGFFNGTYEVIFDQNVSSCSYSATLGIPGNEFGGSPSPGFVSTAGRSGNANGVFVQTWDSAGTPTNESFNLAVFC